MKRFYSLASALALVVLPFIPNAVHAQLLGYSVVEVANHDTTGIEALAGMTTYRVYADLTNPDDKVNAVYGIETAPLSLTSSDGFFNSDFGDDLAQNINVLFISAFPEVEYDSWLTIGYAPCDPVLGNVGTVGMVLPLEEFNNGGDLVLDDQFGGSWFVTTDPNATAGDDLQVLIAQLTTAGTFEGSFNIQVFVNGDQADEQQAEGFLFSSEAGAIFGCMDEAAENYNPDATSPAPCNYACALELTTGTLVPISCPGLSDGEVTVAQTGGQFGVTYGIDGAVPSFTNPNFDDLTAGEHFIVGIDGAGCVDTLEFTIVNPAPLAVSAVLESAVSCNGDQDAVIGGTATGGTGALMYSLNDNTFANATSTLEFAGLGSGNYTIYVQDENGCTASSPSIFVNNPAPINVYVTSSANASCSDSEDGTIIVTTVGGTPGSTGFQYTVDQVNYTTGTNPNGSVLNVGPGTYTVYVSDVNGCTGQTANPVTISSPMALALTLATEGISCTGAADGSVTLAASGGSGGYLYTFNGEDAAGSTIFSDLDAGTYEVTVTDLNDCMSTESVELVDPAAVVASATATDISCYGAADGFVSASVTGGTGTYTFSIDFVSFSADGTFTVGAAGDYTVYAIDSNGCIGQAANPVQIESPSPIQLTINELSMDCDEGGGSVQMDVTGGVPPYSVSILLGGSELLQENNGSNSFEFSGLSLGQHTVRVDDSNLCTLNTDIVVPSEDPTYDCDGNCINDSDLDGICDENEVLGCTDDSACSYNIAATDDDGTCTYPDPGFDCYGNCAPFVDENQNAICDHLEIPGCTYPNSCNFNPDANVEDGSCIFFCPGCTDEAACNYDGGALQENGSCEYPDDVFGLDYVDCEGNCLHDNDGDGVCDEEETPGCMDGDACNFNPDATDQLIACEYPPFGEDCDGNCLEDADEDGICDAFDDCLNDPYNDEDGDGVCFLDEVWGCTDSGACNYLATATEEDESCTYPLNAYVDCDGVCLNDADADGVCDELELPGCQIQSACNYDSTATDSDGSCEFTTCAGCVYPYACNYDPEATIADNTCEFGNCAGCTDLAACNYNPTLTEDDGSCLYYDACGICGGEAPLYYDCEGNCLNDADGDGVCDELEVLGCMDSSACNFDAEATDPGACSYPEQHYDCTGQCLNDTDSDGVCDELEIAGCAATEACNYNAAATDDDGSCTFAVGCDTCSGEQDGTGTVIDNDADDDGVCDADEVAGCIDLLACNFDADPTTDDNPEACLYPAECDTCSGEQDGTGFVLTGDADENGICDIDEQFGCTYAEACNYSVVANVDDGSCTFADSGFDCAGNCTIDWNENGVCDPDELLALTGQITSGDFCAPGTVWNPNLGQCVASYCMADLDGNEWIGVGDLLLLLGNLESGCEIGGCTDPAALNYAPVADFDNGTCVY